MSDVAERMRDYGSNPMVQSEYSMVLARELLEVADEIERLREESDYLGELLLECLDQYIPFKDLDLRSRIKKAIGDE